MNAFQRIWRPEIYHGHKPGRTYFEGWYYKLVSPALDHRYAVIPGVYRHASDHSLSHSFVQVLDGCSGESAVHRYPVEAFRAESDRFDIHIGPNNFQLNQISLDIEAEKLGLKGRLQFEGLVPWPVTPLSPGIMGWYAFTPFMQCYHGVLGFDHVIKGTIQLDNRAVNFDGGRGYMEKDWGQGFPRAYVWMQSNHYTTSGASLSASIATIPWLTGWFRGFIVGFLQDGNLYRFATYLGSKVINLQISKNHVEWVLEGNRRSGVGNPAFSRYRLELSADRSQGASLVAPEPTGMVERVVESLTATIHTRLTGLHRGSQQVLFEESGQCGALEVSGSIEEITG